MNEFLAILANATAKHGWAALFLLMISVVSLNILPSYISRLVSVEKDTVYIQQEISALKGSIDDLHDELTNLNQNIKESGKQLGELQGTLRMLIRQEQSNHDETAELMRKK